MNTMTITIAGRLLRQGGPGMDIGERFGAVLDVHGYDTDDLTVDDTVPIDIDHDGQPIGRVVHVERSAQGDIDCVGVVEHHDELADIGPIYLSATMWCRQAGSDRAWIGRDPHLLSVSLTKSPRQMGLTPVAVLPGDVSSSYARGNWPWQQRSRPLITRAVEATATVELRRAPLGLVDLRPATITITPTPTLELRTADTLDVAERTRTIEVLAAPVGEEATVVIAGRFVGERFARGCFAGDERRADRVKVNRDHHVERVVGKAVRIDPYSALGCVATLRIAKTLLGDETLALAEDRVLDCSVGFRVKPGGETWDAQRTRRQVTRGELDHIALVPDPAYTGANVLAVRTTHR
jgi:phage head maturation protease